MNDASPTGHLRIGELSLRTGVSPELLRAWERRYGLLRPSRSQGGFRLYSSADEERVRRMKAHLSRGIAAAEAARLAESTKLEEPDGGSLHSLRIELAMALDEFDESTGQRVLDTAFDSYTLDSVITDVLLPYLKELGERWAREEVSVAQEHFASTLIRTRLLALARNWDAGYGPRALLACPNDELHDLGLILFGVALNRRGWRILFLGANTPIDTIVSTAQLISPDAVVISVSDPKLLRPVEAGIRELAGSYKVVLAGTGPAGANTAESLGTDYFDVDPVTAAEELAASRR